MKNYICTGERIVVTAPSGGLSAGQVYLIGTKVGVVVSGGAAGESVSVMTEGVFEVAKATGAVTIGQRIYWDNTNSVMTTTASGNTYVGYAFKAAASGDATVFVVIVDNGASSQAAYAANVSTADASDLATAVALANALKTKLNAVLTAIKDAGIMAAS